MSKVIYIDCSAGLSGRALLGALVDLGAKPEQLAEKIKNIVPVPFQLNFSKRSVNGTPALTADLHVDAGQESLYAAAAVNRLINKVPAGNQQAEQLISFFNRFIPAKAGVLSLPAEEIMMTEAEILRLAILTTCFFTALDLLDVNRVIVSPLPVGFHLSARNSDPLLLELARGAAIKHYPGRAVPATPLGAALLTCRADEYGPLPEMLLTKTGYGCASENLPADARVRVLSGLEKEQESPDRYPETITVIETAIDDINPEFFPFIIERLLAGGAADAFLAPIYMKKGRPGHLLKTLCTRSRLEDVLTIIFKETTTLGVRIREEERRILPRYFFKVRTPYGGVAVKAGCLKEGGPPVQFAPEFEDCKKLASQLDVPIKEIYGAAQQAAREYIKKHNP